MERFPSLLDAATIANPYPVYHRLREEDPVHWHESARQTVRALAGTPAYERSRRARYKIEALFPNSSSALVCGECDCVG